MKILLIDNAEQTLEHLNELLKRQSCQTARVTDPLVGLKLLQKHKFDIVISADKLAKTNIANLLKVISIKFPTLVRIACLHELDKQVANKAHYVFQQPLKVEDIFKTILSFQKNHQAITKDVIVKSVAKVKTLPSPPKVYMQLNAILKNANTDSDKIAEIITQDPSLCAKVLQFTNNTFAQTDKPLTNITDAITKMGVDTLSCIVMTSEMFAYQPDIPNFSLIDEQLHALSTARFAASLVSPELKQDTLLAGLLHDIGKLVLFEIDKALTLKYFENSARTSGDIELEKRIFSTDHCQVGAYLLHVWSFPYYLIETVLNHHHPKKLLLKPPASQKLGIAQAVYIANTLLSGQDLHPEFISHYALADSLDTLKNKAERYK